MNSNRQSAFLKAAFDARPMLTSYAFTLLKDWSLSQDIFQEAVIAMNEKSEEIHNESPLPWLKKVIRNRSVDYIRKNQRRQNQNNELSLIIDKKFDEFLNAEKVAELKQKEQALQVCMTKLEPQSRQILLGFYRDKTPCQALGDLFNRSTNAIRLLLSRSRSQLRQCVKKQLAES